MTSHRRFPLKVSHRRTASALSAVSSPCPMTLTIDFDIPSIPAYVANPAKLCRSVSLLLPSSHRIALWLSWCFRAYAMASWVLSIPRRLWRTWIFRPCGEVKHSSERSICSISASRSTKLPETGRSMRRNCTRKLSPMSSSVTCWRMARCVAGVAWGWRSSLTAIVLKISTAWYTPSWLVLFIHCQDS